MGARYNKFHAKMRFRHLCLNHFLVARRYGNGRLPVKFPRGTGRARFLVDRCGKCSAFVSLPLYTEGRTITIRRGHVIWYYHYHSWRGDCHSSRVNFRRSESIMDDATSLSSSLTGRKRPASERSPPTTPRRAPPGAPRSASARLQTTPELTHRAAAAASKQSAPAATVAQRAVSWRNEHLTHPLTTVAQLYRATGDGWRAYAYTKAISVLSNLRYDILTEADLQRFELEKHTGVGAKTLAKIREIVRSGRLVKSTAMAAEPFAQAMAEFTQIHGVGVELGKQWYSRGLRTIQDVLADPQVKLNSAQRLGLQYRDDMKQPIPREEVRAICGHVDRVAELVWKEIVRIPQLQDSSSSPFPLEFVEQLPIVTCCGSFRRGAAFSSDVDVLITHPSFEPSQTSDRPRSRMVSSSSTTSDPAQGYLMERFFDRLLAALKQPALTSRSTNPVGTPFACEDSAGGEPFLLGDLAGTTNRYAALSADVDEDMPEAPPRGCFYMGICRLPNPIAASITPTSLGSHSSPLLARRLDLRCVAWRHRAFATLFLTGSAMFNRSMRHRARDLQMTLSDQGLCPALRRQREKLWIGETVPAQDEWDIFEALGLQYIPPVERNDYRNWTEELRDAGPVRESGV